MSRIHRNKSQKPWASCHNYWRLLVTVTDCMYSSVHAQTAKCVVMSPHFSVTNLQDTYQKRKLGKRGDRARKWQVCTGCEIQTITEYQKSHCWYGDKIIMEVAQEAAQQLREGELTDMKEKVRTMWQQQWPWGCESGKQTTTKISNKKNTP